MTNFHDNKDWNSFQKSVIKKGIILYDQLPWQQGLKLENETIETTPKFTLWPTSMTTRIETITWKMQLVIIIYFMTNFHDNKDWNQK